MKILSEMVWIPRAWGSLSFQGCWKDENILEWFGSNLWFLFAFLGSRACFPWQGSAGCAEEAQHFKKTVSMAEFLGLTSRLYSNLLSVYGEACGLGLRESVVNKEKKSQ